MFSDDFGGMNKIKVNSTLVWKPDIVLHNSVTGNFKHRVKILLDTFLDPFRVII